MHHGLRLLQKDTDVNRRLALLSIDNSVELMLKTYLGLPHRITGIKISRDEFREIGESFPRLLDAAEKHLSGKLAGIDLGEIEWYHRLRNELYHQGNGLTVERAKVEVYAELAKLLYRNLFGVGLDLREDENTTGELLGSFLQAWIRVESIIRILQNIYGQGQRPWISEDRLVQAGHIALTDAQEIAELRRIRTQVVHGQITPQAILNNAVVERTRRLASRLEGAIPKAASG